MPPRMVSRYPALMTCGCTSTRCRSTRDGHADVPGLGRHRIEGDAERCHVLLCEPTTTLAEPLIEQLLLATDLRTRAFRQRTGLAHMTLAS